MTDHKEMKPCKPDYSGSDWAENVGLRAQLSVFSVFFVCGSVPPHEC